MFCVDICTSIRVIGNGFYLTSIKFWLQFSNSYHVEKFLELILQNCPMDWCASSEVISNLNYKVCSLSARVTVRYCFCIIADYLSAATKRTLTMTSTIITFQSISSPKRIIIGINHSFILSVIYKNIQIICYYLSRDIKSIFFIILVI